VRDPHRAFNELFALQYVEASEADAELATGRIKCSA